MVSKDKESTILEEILEVFDGKIYGKEFTSESTVLNFSGLETTREKAKRFPDIAVLLLKNGADRDLRSIDLEASRSIMLGVN